jgi:hypothetical protein
LARLSLGAEALNSVARIARQTWPEGAGSRGAIDSKVSMIAERVAALGV